MSELSELHRRYDRIARGEDGQPVDSQGTLNIVDVSEKIAALREKYPDWNGFGKGERPSDRVSKKRGK